MDFPLHTSIVLQFGVQMQSESWTNTDEVEEKCCRTYASKLHASTRIVHAVKIVRKFNCAEVLIADIHKGVPWNTIFFSVSQVHSMLVNGVTSAIAFTGI